MNYYREARRWLVIAVLAALTAVVSTAATRNTVTHAELEDAKTSLTTKHDRDFDLLREDVRDIGNDVDLLVEKLIPDAEHGGN